LGNKPGKKSGKNEYAGKKVRKKDRTWAKLQGRFKPGSVI